MQQVQMPIYQPIATKDHTLRIVVHGTMPDVWMLLAYARTPPSIAVSTIHPVVGGTPAHPGSALRCDDSAYQRWAGRY